MEKSKKHHSLRRKIGIGLVVVLLVFSAGLLFGANYLMDYAIARKGDGGDRKVENHEVQISDAVESKIDRNKKNYEGMVRQFLSEHTEQQAQVTSPDALKLSGYYFTQSANKPWVVLAHGYRADHTDMYDYAVEYYKRGFNVLLPEMRGIGSSEGQYLGMGYLEKEDMKLWIQWILERDPQASIVFHGNSMGGATVLMLSGEETPEQVKAFVSDSAYTGVWDIFSSELKLRFGLPDFPLLNLADWLAQLKAGYSFREASVVRQVEKSDKPILFIHGKKDDFVPFEMLNQLVAAKTKGEKEVLISEDAGHTDALYDLGETYFQTIQQFLAPYLQ